MGHQQYHTDAAHDEENPQCRRGYWGDPLVLNVLGIIGSLQGIRIMG